MDLKHAIEQDESEEIARRLNSDYYSEEAAIVAREILKDRGYSQDAQIKQLADVSIEENEEYRSRRRRKMIAFLAMLLAPYAYTGIVVFLDAQLREVDTIYRGIYTAFLIVASGYAMLKFYVYTNATVGRDNPYLFLVLIGNMLFVVPLLLIGTVMSLVD